MGLDRFENPARVGDVKTEELLRYEAEFRSIRSVLRATVLVIELAPDFRTGRKPAIPQQSPLGIPPARLARRYSDGRLP